MPQSVATMPPFMRATLPWYVYAGSALTSVEDAEAYTGGGADVYNGGGADVYNGGGDDGYNGGAVLERLVGLACAAASVPGVHPLSSVSQTP
eukprot:1008633-Rhodomonas_salina.1